ncbi:MAG: EamA family transporter, partial [Alphaproteobacteria bacterium]|nr:EamA family transporter [Alphaproteobacteria bacterium]
SNVFTTLLSLIPAIYVWTPITAKDLIMFVALGLVANLILYCLLKSFEIVEASAVAPYRYIELIFASSLGYIFFGEIIDSHIIFGAVIIIIATLFVIYEGLLKKKIRT